MQQKAGEAGRTVRAGPTQDLDRPEQQEQQRLQWHVWMVTPVSLTAAVQQAERGDAFFKPAQHWWVLAGRSTSSRGYALWVDVMYLQYNRMLCFSGHWNQNRACQAWSFVQHGTAEEQRLDCYRHKVTHLQWSQEPTCSKKQLCGRCRRGLVCLQCLGVLLRGLCYGCVFFLITLPCRLHHAHCA